MASRILIGTRKGTFIVEKTDGKWRPRLAGHAGAGVNFVARDPYTGRLWALLGHGHWGAKLSEAEVKRLCAWSNDTADLLMASH